jgi:hypothetical protein
VARYDEPLKRLGRLCPKDFIQWLCPQMEVLPNQIHFEDREFEIARRSADLLYRIKDSKYGEFQLHLEFQGILTDDFVLRLFEYSTLIYKNTNLPVKTVAIFLENTVAIEALSTICQNKLGSEVFSEFRFTKIILSKESWRDILDKKLPALLPLIPFCSIKPGDELEALQETQNLLETLEDERLKLELETVFAILGGYRFPQFIRRILGEKRMKDLMESVIYQEMFKQATTNATIKTYKNNILNILEARFNNISPQLKEKVRLIHLEEVLSLLVKSAATVHTLEEFEKLL